MTNRLAKLCREWRDEDAFRQPDLNDQADMVKVLMAVMLESTSPQIAGEALAQAREILYAAIPNEPGDERPIQERMGDASCRRIAQEFSLGHSRALRQANQAGREG